MGWKEDMVIPLYNHFPDPFKTIYMGVWQSPEQMFGVVNLTFATGVKKNALPRLSVGKWFAPLSKKLHGKPTGVGEYTLL